MEEGNLFSQVPFEKADLAILFPKRHSNPEVCLSYIKPE